MGVCAHVCVHGVETVSKSSALRNLTVKEGEGWDLVSYKFLLCQVSGHEPTKKTYAQLQQWMDRATAQSLQMELWMRMGARVPAPALHPHS